MVDKKSVIQELKDDLALSTAGIITERINHAATQGELNSTRQQLNVAINALKEAVPQPSDNWHIICGLLMKKLGVERLEITEEDFDLIDGKTNIACQVTDDVMTVFFMPVEEVVESIAANDEEMETKPGLPLYQSHKVVGALKIKGLRILPDFNDDAYVEITPYEEGYKPFNISRDWYLRHNPEQNGYYVEYQDGYSSYSPAEAFESGYTLIV